MDVDIGPTLSHGCVTMPKTDRDLIEALWRQDIDMGITREDSFPTKGEMELEKTKPVQEKAPHSDWQYNIDCETGEQLPIPRTGPPTESTQVVPSQDVTVPDSRGLSFEDCLNLLDSFNPQVEDPSSSVVPPLVDAVEIEQRWQDLASISELQMSPLLVGNNSVDAAPSRFPNATWNSSIPADEQNVFAFNATTNGNVNLQNATSPQMSLFNSTSQQMETSRLLAVDIQDSELFSGVNDTQMNTTSSAELFSPISSFNNMSISAVPPSPASSQGSSVNLTMMMLDQQEMEQENSTVSPVPTTAPQNPSLLLDLLNSTKSTINETEMDSDMHELDSMITMLASSINGEDGSLELLSEDESFSADESEGSLEGATGFNREALKQEFGKGFTRGGASPCHSDISASSSLDSNQNSDSIHHNHSYASSSEAGSPKGFRSYNRSKNGSFDEDGFNRPSRDERRAKELNIPIPIEKIINLPVDSFNDLLKKYDFNNKQLQLIRDIRRRGKNKVAAQNCRKRKISAIQQVEGSVGAMQNEHDKLLKERDKVNEELSVMQSRFDDLYNQVFRTMRDRNGDLVDPSQFRLEIMEDGSVILVPQNRTNSTGRHHKTDRKYSSN